jgi:hypothetical protein
MSADQLVMQSATPQDPSDAWIDAQIAAGARLVRYQYCFSIVVMSYRRRSGVKLIKPGQSRLTAGLPYTLLALVAGPWGIPFGLIWTIQSIWLNTRGGIDITAAVMARRQGRGIAPAGVPVAGAPSSGGWQSI